MKNVLLSSLVLLLACGRSTESSRAELDELSRQKVTLTSAAEELQKNVSDLAAAKRVLEDETSRLAGDVRVLRAEKEGRGVHYVLRCSLRQIHYSLSIKKQIADAVNEENFDLVTDKESYDRAAVGSNLFDSFRMGSAVLKGSLGSWRIKVEGKRVEVDP